MAGAQTGRVRAGAHFGDAALRMSVRRPNAVRAVEDCVLVEVPSSAFIAAASTSNRDAVMANVSALRRCFAFSRWPRGDTVPLAACCRRMRFRPHCLIVRQGQLVPDVFIIVKGSVRIYQDVSVGGGQTLTVHSGALTAGCLFGDDDVENKTLDSPHVSAVSVVAASEGFVDCLVINRALLWKYVSVDGAAYSSLERCARPRLQPVSHALVRHVRQDHSCPPVPCTQIRCGAVPAAA